MTQRYYQLARDGLRPKQHKSLAAVRTGEFRAPRRGEWYLSGAIPEAWQAPNDLSQSYHIVRLHADRCPKCGY